MMAIVKHGFFILDASNPEQQEFRIGASPNPQNIPDWVTKTPTYKRGVETGSIFEVNAPAKKAKKNSDLEAENQRLADAASYAEMEKRNAQKASADADRLIAEQAEEIERLKEQLASASKPKEPEAPAEPPAEPNGDSAEGKKGKSPKSK